MVTSGIHQGVAGPVVTQTGRWVAYADAQGRQTKAVCAPGWPRPWPYMAKVSAAWSRPRSRPAVAERRATHNRPLPSYESAQIN